MLKRDKPNVKKPGKKKRLITRSLRRKKKTPNRIYEKRHGISRILSLTVKSRRSPELKEQFAPVFDGSSSDSEPNDAKTPPLARSQSASELFATRSQSREESRRETVGAELSTSFRSPPKADPSEPQATSSSPTSPEQSQPPGDDLTNSSNLFSLCDSSDVGGDDDDHNSDRNSGTTPSKSSEDEVASGSRDSLRVELSGDFFLTTEGDSFESSSSHDSSADFESKISDFPDPNTGSTPVLVTFLSDRILDSPRNRPDKKVSLFFSYVTHVQSVSGGF